MKRVLLTVEYDGTAYHGWQVQPNGITVQEVLQSALAELLGKKTDVTGCSRTDAGVHAKEFCCHLDCDDSIPDTAFLKGLNSILPEDIAVKGCTAVPNDFHARYSAKGKTYEYKILNTDRKSAFDERYAWRIDRKLDTDKMNLFLKGLVGKHDFYAFSSSGRTVEDTVRTVTECYADRCGDTVTVTVSADGFLYNMVRIIVGTAAEVSFGKIAPEATEKIFESRDRSLAGITAPAKGLFLKKVHYGGEIIAGLQEEKTQ